MAVRHSAPDVGARLVTRWHIGVGVGIAAVIPMVVANMLLTGNSFPSLFGLLPYAVLWGLVFVGITTVDRVHDHAADPRTGPLVGVGYSALVWIGPQLGEPIGGGVFTPNGVLQVVLFGVTLGWIYAVTPAE